MILMYYLSNHFFFLVIASPNVKLCVLWKCEDSKIFIITERVGDNYN